MEEKKGIKECKELLALLKVLAMAGKKASADGKVDAKDLLILVELLQEVSVVVEGIKGLDMVDDELKDLDSEEIAELGAELIAILSAVRAA